MDSEGRNASIQIFKAGFSNTVAVNGFLWSNGYTAGLILGVKIYQSANQFRCDFWPCGVMYHTACACVS